MRRCSLTIGIFLAATSLSFADLEWKSKKIVSRADAKADRISAEFEVTNTGKTPITIISAAPNCECVRARVPEKPINAGAKGKIEVVFEAGQRGGEQKVWIMAWTDLPDDKPIRLEWKIMLPEVLKLEPEVLVWEEETKKPLQTRVTFPDAAATKIIKLSCDDPAFKPRFTDDHTIEVVREGVPSHAITLLRVETDSNLSRLKEIVIPMVYGNPTAD